VFWDGLPVAAGRA